MEKPLLSILIPTIEGRDYEFGRLFEQVARAAAPYGDQIEIYYLKDNKEITIGEKRNRLYNIASGLYSIQIDDDDAMADGWLEKVMPAIAEGPDCITYQEKCIIDGAHYRSNHSIKYADWWTNMDGFDYVRTPFMKDVIKTEIAQSVLVPHIRFGEDHAWSRLIKPLLKNEVHIDEELYYYLHESSDHNIRYGITAED